MMDRLEVQYSENLKHLKARESQLADQTARYPDKLLAKWKMMSDVPVEEKGKVISLFEAQLKDSPPTQRKAYEKLLEDEKIGRYSGKDLTANAQFLNQGIELEDTQVQILAQAKVSASDRKKLYNDLVEWQATQLRLCPSLGSDYTQLIDPESPESVPLNLPSSFPQHIRAQLKLETLASEEYRLREGQAHNTLEGLRLTIQTYNFNLDFKKSNVREDKKKAAARYTRARQALLNLGLPANNKVLRKLDHTKLHGKNTAKPPNLGDLKREDPWFWNVGRPKAMSEKEEREWQIKPRDRAQEEKEILEEEIRREIKTFLTLAMIWTKLGDGASDRPGKAAYAFKQATMYTSLQRDAEEMAKRVDGKKSAMTKEDAKREVSRHIRQLITSKVGPPPEYSVKPFHRGHRVTVPQLNLGFMDYRKAGSWYQMCVGPPTSECWDVKKVIQAAPYDLVMVTSALFRLFLLYEEVLPDTEAAHHGRFQIHTAPGFQELWEEHYLDRDLQQQENESVLLEAGPSRGGNTIAQGGSYDISSFISLSPSLPSPRSALVQMALPGNASKPISISDDDSDVSSIDDNDMPAIRAVPVLVVAWIKDNARYCETLIISHSDRAVCLNNHKLERGACGIEAGDKLEVYKPTLHRWFPVGWATILGLFTSASGNSLFPCRSNVYRLQDFNLVQPIASHVPQLSMKGKGRAL
ncbi:hypothetical protein H1R20_g6389, partial [Candolleomyces eurysporus]